MPDVENDALICDAVAAVAMQTPLPAYIKPAELAGLTRLPPQTIGLTVGRLFGIARIRDRGYPAAKLVAAYHAYRAEEEERLEQERLEQERGDQMMQAVKDKMQERAAAKQLRGRRR